ncbi:MAG TPA: hypothetical protein IAA26_11535 [Candidatus Blautia faecipullorum]|nr:hypothetical protein [Candidatus Blautia faecipullorum]
MDVIKNKSKLSEEFEKECIRLQKELFKIEEGELYLQSEPNYEYDEWYDNDDEEVFFRDPHGVGNVIKAVCQYLHRCVDCEEYTYGYEIAKRLVGLKIYAEGGEWEDYYDFLSIEDLKYHDLIDIDYKKVVIDGLYLAYQANVLQDRAEALYRMIENSHRSDITLEMMMQNGEELTDITEFLPVWISYLGRISTAYAQNLLKEALELTGDPEILLSNARKFCEQHPALYEQYLDFVWSTDDSEKLFSVGDEALEKISAKYVVRSRIAKRLSLLALEEQKKDTAERYWLEAFRSETTVTNCMRLLVESSNVNVFSERIRRIYHSMYKKIGISISMHGQSGELKINHPNSDTIYMLAFLGGEFQYVQEHAMNVTAVLGWSSTFMKCGLSAFLLFLMESDELQSGGREMCRKVVSAVDFDKEEYQRWTGRQNDLSSEEWFWECLKKWKENVEMSEAQRQDYLQWIEKLIKKRVDGIMEANRRNYYGECASYIAALGEVLESQGQQGAKQRILLDYKEMYSRRRAFHEELRKYGMRDTRKRR